jgi:hypothetical protein
VEGMITLKSGKYFELLYNNTNIDLSTLTHLDESTLSNYFIVNKKTGKVEGVTLAEVQANNVFDTLEYLTENPTSTPGESNLVPLNRIN